MRTTVLQTLLLTLAARPIGAQEAPPPPPPPAIFGLELLVPDLPAAVAFYRDALGFALVDEAGAAAARLDLGGFGLLLTAVEPGLPHAAEGAARLGMDLWAADLSAAAEAVAAAGGEVGDVGPFPLGRFVPASDPWGHRFELLEVEGFDAGGAPLAVFDVGLVTRAYGELEPFLDSLGFQVASRRYLPTALPYSPGGASSLVAHEGASSACDPRTRHARLLLEVERIEPALEALAARGAFRTPPRVVPSAFGRAAVLRSPAGLAFRLLERSPQQLAFERLRAQAGTWEGRSTLGWRATCTIEPIARGSAVVQRSGFEAHPGETMLTVYHMDRGELLLTHYCVAGNQPRLRATRFADGGREVAFTWLDGTNLASRDEWHMDEVVLRFAAPDAPGAPGAPVAPGAFAATWSSYQAGEQRPMEEISYSRVDERSVPEQEQLPAGEHPLR